MSEYFSKVKQRKLNVHKQKTDEVVVYGNIKTLKSQSEGHGTESLGVNVT